MKPEVYKIILVVQDLETKDKKTLAVLSGDVHYYRSAKDKIKQQNAIEKISVEKDPKKKEKLQKDFTEIRNVASFQMALNSNKDLQNHIKSLALEAITLKESKK